jgi:hypothetical protein
MTMAKRKKPTKRVSNHWPKKWRSPKPELFDWSKFDPSMARGTHAAELAEHLVTYRDHLKELLHDKGKYVLIKGHEVVGIYAERDEAMREAIARFGGQPVLIKQIVAKEPMISMGGVIL